MKELKLLKAKALNFSDGSVHLCIPLWDEEMKSFQRKLMLYFEKRGEEVHFVPDAYLIVYTKLNGVQLERLSNRILRKILKERR